MLKIAVILPAAGIGARFDTSMKASGRDDGKSKIDADLSGQPVFMRSLGLFVHRADVGQVILAVNPDHIDDFKFRWGDKLNFHGVIVVPGGKSERWETVLNALGQVDRSCTHVAVHDAVRPLASDKLINRIFEAAQRYDAVIPAVPVNATLKAVVDCDETESQAADPMDAILGSAGKANVDIKRVEKTVDRTNLVAVQTPQVFERGLLGRAYEQITQGKLDPAGITDDAGLIEAMGEPVYVVQGEVTNLKITRADDLELAAAIIEKRDQSKVVSLGAKRLFGNDDDD